VGGMWFETRCLQSDLRTLPPRWVEQFAIDSTIGRIRNLTCLRSMQWWMPVMKYAKRRQAGHESSVDESGQAFRFNWVALRFHCWRLLLLFRPG
jgi:hypothetical protein